ncbi:hypothetical protein HYDPIDRAFT_106117 [Hydnomerulius pinastri MD-312]|nr:hypothetical protein HYDPIDRAFT_106117 [Hydnomerulius pinastri MD-312]
MNDQPKVAIFWDYENCSPPSNSPGLGYDIVNNVGRMARVFGSVTTFKAYLDISSQSPKSVVLRSELQSSGVSMIDCPHNGKKDVVDKMILVDMLAFAVDHSAPATVVLITGDRDYAYAVSTLRLRKYKVVLIVPSSPHIPTCLESQASLAIDWSTAVLRTRAEATNPFVRQPYLDLDADLVTQLAREVRDLLDDSNTTASSSSSGPSTSRTRRISARDLLDPPAFGKSVTSDSNEATLEAKYSHLFPETLRKTASTGNESGTPGLPVPNTPSRSRRGSVAAPAPTPLRARSATVASAQSPPKVEKEPVVRSTASCPVTTARRSSAPDIADIAGLVVPSTSALPAPETRLELPAHYDGPPSSIIIGSPLEAGPSTSGRGDPPRHASQPVPVFNHRLNCSASPFIITRTLSGGVPVSYAGPAQKVVTTAGSASTVIPEEPGKVTMLDPPLSRTSSPHEELLRIPNEAALMEALGLDEDEIEQFLPCHTDPDTILVEESQDVEIAAMAGHTNAVKDSKPDADGSVARLPDSRPPAEGMGVPSSKPTPPQAVMVSTPCATTSSPLGPSNEFKQTNSPAAPQASRSVHSSPEITTVPPPASAPSTGATPSVPLPSAGVVPEGAPEPPTTAIVEPDDDAVRQQTRTKFQPLIHVLLLARAKGVERPLRTNISMDLIQYDNAVYKRAGVTKFKHYVALAAKAGLIKEGGIALDAWIALHPSWFTEAQQTGNAKLNSKATETTTGADRFASSIERHASSISTESSMSSASSPAPQEGGSLPHVPLHSPEIPAYFQPLIDTLVRMRDNGFHQTLRSLVGLSLGAQVYARAGVPGFKEYIVCATEARLVQCGGEGGHAWMRLHPDLRV